MNKRQRVYMRLSADSVEKLASVARATGRSQNELFQDAVDRLIAEHDEGTPSLMRMAQTTEFIQIAVDLMIRRDMPEEREAIMLSIAKRMEKFHGKRWS